ncbi:hypothetical protein K443DRAFT_330367 [Laccaria amethystina LaAM-08-1]|uniref:Uncharacterized protein n=1 Tax=Laccaria amethystina LaAM-08-1 TaxID=1095629 RepID=A0A0C9X236_9AGAR|nr:hypothetical protein K443DRAFT_330367 [Laccaria amethystina LaAM-08-1]
MIMLGLFILQRKDKSCGRTHYYVVVSNALERVYVYVGISLVIHLELERINGFAKYMSIWATLPFKVMNEEDRKGIVKNASDDHTCGRSQVIPTRNLSRH